MQKRSRARKKAEWARVYGSLDRVRFVAALPCRVPGCGRRPSENAHACTGGTGRKADARFILPLCRTHHRELHGGAETFQAKYGIDLLACAEWTEWKWQQAGSFVDELEY